MRVSDTLEKRQHSVLRIDNRMTAFGLKDLTSREQNIWWTIVKLIYNKGTDELTLLRSEIESISGYKSLKERDSNGNYVDKFIYEMKVLGKKLLSLNTEIIDNETNECVLFTIFPVFKVDSNCIHIRVSEYFSPWFNDLKLNYTRLDLTVMLGLKSNYAKNLYRYLIRWQNYKTDDTDFPGCWIVDVDRFRNLMDIPKTYNNNDIFRRVIEPSLKEFEKKDENGWAPFLRSEVIKVNKKGTKRKIVKYIFKFKANRLTDKVVNEMKLYSEGVMNLGLSSSNSSPLYSENKFAYENVFKDGYIPGESSGADNFVKWIYNVGIEEMYPIYFGVRVNARKEIGDLYKKTVSKNTRYNRWTDMNFLATLISVITKDEGVTFNNFVKHFERFRKDFHSMSIPNKFIENLGEVAREELNEFTNIAQR